MQFERLIALAKDTATEALCDAWGASHDAVLSVKNQERPMTVREVGALAAMYGLLLADILAI